MKNEKKIGLIAGGGRLPCLVAEGMKAAGKDIVCLAFTDDVDAGLREMVDSFQNIPIARPCNWIRKFRRQNVTQAIMVGAVPKQKIHTPCRILKFLPDWRGLRVWYWRLRGKDRNDDMILRAIADELASGGIILENSTMYCKEHLATAGVMTNCKPTGAIEADIEFGWKIIKDVTGLGIGQAIAVKEGGVIAVEAIEGTAKMIERAGENCKNGGWSLIKAARPNQDMRLDVPCIGKDTIKSMAENGGKCIVVEAGKTIILDKDEAVELANKLGVVIVGRES